MCEKRDMMSALAVCGRPVGEVGALKSRSKMLDPEVEVGAAVGPAGAAPVVGCGAATGGCGERADGGAVVTGGGTSSDPNRSTMGAAAGAGEGFGACVRDSKG